MPGLKSLWIVGLTIPLTIDGTANYLEVWDSHGWLRALTGLLMGVSLPQFLALLKANDSKPITYWKMSLAVLMSLSMGLMFIYLLVAPPNATIFNLLAFIVAMALFSFLTDLIVQCPFFKIKSPVKLPVKILKYGRFSTRN